MREIEPLWKCPVCGKYYKARKGKNGKIQQTCSKECGYKNLHKQGTLSYFASKNNMTEKQFMDLIDKEHNENLMTIKNIAEKYGIVRISLMRWCKKYGVKTRTISEDNYRRYSTMTEEQIKEQTKKANEGIRELFKDPQWKEQQIEKVMTAQDMKPSRPENLFYEKITEMGYYPERQYRKDMGGFALDFAFPEIKLAIEIDGEYWHNLEKTKVKDRRRNYYLGVKKGWEVIHIPAKDFTQHSEHYVWEVIQTIETLKIA